MVAISATNSTTPSLQAVLARTRLEQARREADQAEANAQNLRAQADQAERLADDKNNKVQQLATRDLQPDPTYPAPARVTTSEDSKNTRDIYVERYKVATQTLAENRDTLHTILNATPVRYTESQAKGQIVNLTA